MNETTTRITDVRTVAVPVADQDRALDFYVGKLGFEKRMDASFGPGRRWVEVAPPGASTSIALAAGPTPGVDTGVRFTTTDAAADHADLRARGVDVDAELLRMGAAPPMFTLRDADGNRLVVVQDRP
jgi:catechol 2,3-dioxygenase-like lactoylglutathione lyase family enzyme